MFPMDTGGPCCSRACVATTSAASCTHNHACYMPLPPILNSMEMFKLFEVVMCESTCVVILVMMVVVNMVVMVVKTGQDRTGQTDI